MAIDLSKPDISDETHLKWFESILIEDGTYPYIANYKALYNALTNREGISLDTSEIDEYKDSIKDRLITRENKSNLNRGIVGLMSEITDQSLDAQWQKEFVQDFYKKWVTKKEEA